jgi:hypothetical protein
MRYSDKWLLVVFAAVALWLSTLAGYKGGGDVRASILFVFIFAAAFQAIYYRGRRQAFWIGFTVALLLLMLRQGEQWPFVPSFIQSRGIALYWAAQVPKEPLPPNMRPGGPDGLYGRQAQVYAALFATIRATFALALSVLVGLIGVYVYNHSRRE